MKNAVTWAAFDEAGNTVGGGPRWDAVDSGPDKPTEFVQPDYGRVPSITTYTKKSKTGKGQKVQALPGPK